MTSCPGVYVMCLSPREEGEGASSFHQGMAPASGSLLAALEQLLGLRPSGCLLFPRAPAEMLSLWGPSMLGSVRAVTEGVACVLTEQLFNLLRGCL